MPVVTSYEDVLDFWFTASLPMPAAIARQSSLWWGKDAAVDADIACRFSASLEALLAGQLDDWKQSPQGRLAMILLADQFSRNIYRDTARAFAQDELALALSLEGIAEGADLQLNLLQRVFFYLPLEHAESMAMQDESVKLQRQLLDSAADDVAAAFRGFYTFALKHREVIEKFGRYPHRNAILGRESSAAEAAYLSRPGAGF